MSDEWIGKKVIPIDGNPAQLCSSIWKCVGYENGKLVLEGAPGIRYNLAPRYIMLAPETKKSDILKRAKDQLKSRFRDDDMALIEELISEVEAKNDKIAQDAITIQMHHGNVLTLQKEVERLRSNWRQEHATAETWKEDFKKMQKRLTDSELLRQAQYNQIAAKDARITVLEAAVCDDRAQYLLLLDTNRNTVAWQLDEISEQDQDKFRRQARESLKMEEPWVYVQLREARERIKELEAEAQEYHDKKEEALTLCAGQNRYIEGLEAAFLKAESQRLWDLGKSTGKTSYDCQEAREALEELKG